MDSQAGFGLADNLLQHRLCPGVVALIVLLRALLGLASSVAKYVERKQLMEAGEARMVSNYLQGSLVAIDRAKRARHGVSHSDNSVRDDPDNRD